MNQPSAQQKGRDSAPGHSQNLQSNHSVSFHQAQADFLDAMHAAGVAPADYGVIVGDGELHRYRVEGDKPNTKNGYFTLHMDGIPAGHFGSWKHGIAETWCAKSRDSMTRAEREDMRRRMDEARAAAARATIERQHKAADEARRIWNDAELALPVVPYLRYKNIKKFCARSLDNYGTLVLPIIDIEGRLRSLQFIDQDRQKRFLTGGQKKGCFILVNDPEYAKRIVICEGYATAATLAENMPDATVIAALDAGNLQPVAEAIRKKYPDADLVIACDNDRATKGNPGLNKGRAAALAVDAKLLIPEFPADAPLELSDFNDLVNYLQHGGRTHA